jgi:RNA polymerase sigma-B factor
MSPSTSPSPPDAPVRPRGEYDHLLPLFAQRDALPEGHPRRRALRTELIVGYQPVARHIARRYFHRTDCPDDLEQTATVGLILAVDRFDARREVDFLPFAVPTINGEVLRYFRDRSSVIRIPRRLRHLQGEVVGATAELSQRLGRAPRPSEIAAALDRDREDVLAALASQGATYASSLDELTSEGGGDADRGPRLAAALACAEPGFDLLEDRRAVATLVAQLPERERYVLLLRFFCDLTQTEIAALVGVSQMHVSRLLSRTLAALRRELVAD